MLTIVRTRHWQRAGARLMGTAAEVIVDGTPDHIRLAFARLRRLEQCWSRFRPDSELNQLVDRAGRWTTVSDDLAVALAAAQRARLMTDGIVDVAVRPALEALGYDRTFTDVQDGPIAASAPVGIDPVVELDDHRARVRPGSSVDLGGIGKGLAADLVAGELLAAGAVTALVSIGGDMRATGEPPTGGWPVPVVDPASGDIVATHLLTDCGMAMSTTVLRRWTRQGTTVHHLVDPRTGTSAVTDLAAVAVAAPTALHAEVLAKAATIVGTSAGRALLHRSGVTSWLIEEAA